jgi:hypothetical protein
MRTGKIPDLLKRNGMLLVLEESTYTVKARLNAAKARLLDIINFNWFQCWK